MQPTRDSRSRARAALSEARRDIGGLRSLFAPETCLENPRSHHWTVRTQRIFAAVYIDDLGMRKLPVTAAEDLLELVMRRYERVSTIITSNRPVDDWGKVLGDVAATSAMLDRLLHHCHVVTCGPRSYRTQATMKSEQEQP